MNKKVVVVGGGLAGISAAIRLARVGFKVQLFEKNSVLGGKMGEVTMNGFRFDTGPSLLTMPFVIDELFSFAGLQRLALLDFIPVEPICRYFYPDGTRLNTFSDHQKMMAELQEKMPGQEKAFEHFMKHSRNIYDLAAGVFLFTPFQEMRKLFRKEHLPAFFKIHRLDAMKTMHRSISEYFTDDRLVQLFDRYATYNGSNPFQAPATLNIIPYAEYGLGAYYIRGGMYRLAETLEMIARNLGVEINTSAPVEKIVHAKQRITGVRVNGEIIATEYVLCNADVVEAHNHLLDGVERRAARLNKLEPSLSGMVFLWGMDRKFPELAHHNILFSSDYQREFSQIFDDLQAPDDPTVYISITSKTDPEHAPQNCENWFILLNMPYLSGKQNWGAEVDRMRSRILEKMQRYGLDAESHITMEKVLTPQDLYNLYRSNRGSIYGISSNSRMTAFKRPANRSRDINGLYFAGGSAHPGGGIPLVLLSGKMAAELISEAEGINWENTRLRHRSASPKMVFRNKVSTFEEIETSHYIPMKK